MTRRLFGFGIGLGFALASAIAAEVPRKAPELAIQLPTGQHVLLSQFRGKVVLLEFVYTTCPHCQASSTIVERLYKELGPRGFQPLAMAFNPDAEKLVADFTRQLGLTFPVGFGARDTVIEYLQYPMVQPVYVPQMVFVDRKGVVRAQHGGEDDFFKNQEANLRTQIEALLQEPAGKQRSSVSKPHSELNKAAAAQ